MKVLSKTKVEILGKDKITRPIYELVKALQSINDARITVEVRGSRPPSSQAGSLESMLYEARRRGEL